MKHISGGYYIISPSKRADYMNETLLPETILSASECLCDFYPEIDILWGTSLKKKQNYSKELNLPKDTFEEMAEWVERQFQAQSFQYPQLFASANLASEFVRLFLSHLNDIKIIGIGLPENLVTEFLDEEETLSKPAEERYGIEKLLFNRTAMDKGAAKVYGYEVLGFEYGKFHSYICNGLENDYNDKFQFTLNENGFIPTLGLAKMYCDYSNDDEVGTEPVLWLPWAIYEYNI